MECCVCYITPEPNTCSRHSMNSCRTSGEHATLMSSTCLDAMKSRFPSLSCRTINWSSYFVGFAPKISLVPATVSLPSTSVRPHIQCRDGACAILPFAGQSLRSREMFVVPQLSLGQARSLLLGVLPLSPWQALRRRFLSRMPFLRRWQPSSNLELRPPTQ